MPGLCRFCCRPHFEPRRGFDLGQISRPAGATLGLSGLEPKPGPGNGHRHGRLFGLSSGRPTQIPGFFKPAHPITGASRFLLQRPNKSRALSAASIAPVPLAAEPAFSIRGSPVAHKRPPSFPLRPLGQRSGSRSSSFCAEKGQFSQPQSFVLPNYREYGMLKGIRYTDIYQCR